MKPGTTAAVVVCCVVVLVLVLGLSIGYANAPKPGSPVAFAPEPQLLPDGRDGEQENGQANGQDNGQENGQDNGQENGRDTQITVHVNMTTIPERFRSDWFADNMRRTMITMRGKFVWWCNVPPVFDFNGEPYVVNDKVKQLLADFPNFRLFRTEKDYGPVTKILGPLYNPEIAMDAPLLICDDDCEYKHELVRIAAGHFTNDPTRVYTFCGAGVFGFRGFVVQKSQCVDIAENMPLSCRRIDDDLLDLHFQGKTVPIRYLGSTDAFCTIVNHAGFKLALSKDFRPPMVKACRRDFRRRQRAQGAYLCSTPLELVLGAVHNNICGTNSSSNLSAYFPPLLDLLPDGLPDGLPIPLARTGLEHTTAIPKIIWRTAADDRWRTQCRSAFDMTATTNPDWKQIVLTDTQVLAYIRSTYAFVPEIVQAAEQIQLGVMLADLWRLLIVYDKGGLYLDLKCPAVKPIEQCVNLATDKSIVCQWYSNNPSQAHLFQGGEFVNWVILAPPRNPAIWAAVCRVVTNLHALQTHEDHEFMMLAENNEHDSFPKKRVLCTTGPIAFTSALLTVPHAIQIVSANLNGAVQYQAPVSGEMMSLRPDHYSKYTGRFLRPSDPSKECVPRIVHVSWTTRDAVPQKVWDNLAKFVGNGFELRFYSNQDCSTFMNDFDTTGKIGRLYAAIKKGAHKADAFRYAVLYKMGGVWLDIKTVLMQPIETFLDLTVPFTTVLTPISRLVYQGILACAPKMALMAQCLADSLALGTELHGRNYLTNLRFLTRVLARQLSARYGATHGSKQLRIGRNLGMRFDFDLLVERVSIATSHENRDRYGFDSNIYDADGRHVVKTRYNDFPWPAK